jgi:hypothetical protein
MKATPVILMLLLIGTAGCRKDELPVTQVKVWDADFNVICTITNSVTLATLEEIWQDRTEVSHRPKFTHKVDIATSEGSVRWLYHPDGYATVLGIKVSIPIYRVREPERLKEMLIPQQPPERDK